MAQFRRFNLIVMVGIDVHENVVYILVRQWEHNFKLLEELYEELSELFAVEKPTLVGIELHKGTHNGFVT